MIRTPSVSAKSISALAACAGLALPGAAPAATIHVNAAAPAGGDGATWASAYDDLRDALAAASRGDQIWVAAGIYAPAPPSGDRLATFELRVGVALYGGFDGTERLLEERDVASNVTVLSGDLNGDDGPGFANNDENSYHVVTGSGVDPTSILDGFTIRGGNADGDENPACFGGPNHDLPCSDDGDCGEDGACVSINSKGAGLIAVGGSPVIANCTFDANFAAFQGGAMLLKEFSDVTMTDCTFTGNRALDNGGALYLGLSSPTITRCRFIGNTGGNYAGASCNRDLSNAAFIDCHFEANTAAESRQTGGGAIVNASSSPSFTNCTFVANESFQGDGGAMYNKLGFNPKLGPSSPVVIGCTFESNVAGERGGAVYNEAGSAPTFEDCVFESSRAAAGGAFYNQDSAPVVTGSQFLNGIAEGPDSFEGYGASVYNIEGTPQFTDCLFSGNSSSRYGAVMYSEGVRSTATFVGCTMTGNEAVLGGSGFYNSLGSHLEIDRCHFSGNTGNAVVGGSGLFCLGASATVTNSSFIGNSAGGDGGAVLAWIDGNTITCVNSLFVDNAGGSIVLQGLAVTSNEVTVISCTVADTVLAGSSVVNNNGDMTVANSIVWNSLLLDNGNTTVVYSNTLVPTPGIGNISDDPLFVDAAGGDFHLLAGSACIDAGSNDAVPAGVVADLDGNPRFADDPDTPDTGQGTPPLVDIGAYEFPSPCPADLDGSGAVGTNDLLALLAAWGETPVGPPDLDGDGVVGAPDLLILLAEWGPC